jgi:hypothetical protein
MKEAVSKAEELNDEFKGSVMPQHSRIEPTQRYTGKPQLKKFGET